MIKNKIERGGGGGCYWYGMCTYMGCRLGVFYCRRPIVGS